jgi:hypothetical protein
LKRWQNPQHPLRRGTQPTYGLPFLSSQLLALGLPLLSDRQHQLPGRLHSSRPRLRLLRIPRFLVSRSSLRLVRLPCAFACSPGGRRNIPTSSLAFSSLAELSRSFLVVSPRQRPAPSPSRQSLVTLTSSGLEHVSADFGAACSFHFHSLPSNFRQGGGAGFPAPVPPPVRRNSGGEACQNCEEPAPSCRGMLHCSSRVLDSR